MTSRVLMAAGFSRRLALDRISGLAAVLPAGHARAYSVGFGDGLPAKVPSFPRGAQHQPTLRRIRYQQSRPKLQGLEPLDTFPRRHIGPDGNETHEMLQALDPPADSMDAFIRQVVPADLRSNRELVFQNQMRMHPPPYNEAQVAEIGASLAEMNSKATSFLGGDHHGTLLPEVIKRDILQNPAWYTSYTPYQPEISQGRLESLLNFQTLVTDLTALPIANASLLDVGTAAAEAMTLSLNALPTARAQRPGKTMLVSSGVLRNNVDVMRGRAQGFGVAVEVIEIPSPGFAARVAELGDDLVGVMVQYPDQFGKVDDFREVAEITHSNGALLSCATDLLALTVMTPPGEWGADVAFGTSQRLGVPMGNGGPAAAFFAVAEKHKRRLPGRLVGVSKDRLGGRALRLALQTREQHIRREKATSNVCTSQALLANVSAMYAVYHGPDGLRAIAESIIRKARALQTAAEKIGYTTVQNPHDPQGRVAWDTVVIDLHNKDNARALLSGTLSKQRPFHAKHYANVASFTVDEATTEEDLDSVLEHLANKARELIPRIEAQNYELSEDVSEITIPDAFRRTSPYLTHPVFNSHHSETELMRYMHHLQSKDLSLVHSMIPLGSCTMKLNGAVEMSLITLPGFSNLHPMTLQSGRKGYHVMQGQLRDYLCEITGMDACLLQPNSGAQGEFAGLRTIRDYHISRGDDKRDICLIPVSAHGTNPASAAMAGMRVVPIKCDTKTGNLDMADLEAKCQQHADRLGAIMITYPSTFGVFEPDVRRACNLVHLHGGQVYLDGANMNAQIGLCSPGGIGADVCHLNLHKTFCIPHGGGGPGVGPICVKGHLANYLPSLLRSPNKKFDGVRNLPVSSSPTGSASILPISWAYISLMGPKGLKQATETAILSANYLLCRLRPHYPILYTNAEGRCAHEFIIDARPFRETAGVEAIDIAKRLQDYGFHAPTMSWPVPNTLMIEPTESESKEELDRFADALISIRQEIRDVEEGKQPRLGNVLKNAPHPMHDIIDGDGADGGWERPYTRQTAAYPLPWLREKKFWPSVARIDDTYGDLNLFCTCPPVEDTTGGVDISSVQTTETK